MAERGPSHTPGKHEHPAAVPSLCVAGAYGVPRSTSLALAAVMVGYRSGQSERYAAVRSRFRPSMHR